MFRKPTFVLGNIYKTKKKHITSTSKTVKKDTKYCFIITIVYVFPSHYIIMHFKYASEIMSKPSTFDVFDKNDSTASFKTHQKF